MELIFQKKFQKQAKKLTESNSVLKKKISLALIDFKEKGRKAGCYRKKLKGNLVPKEELQIGGDIRIIIEFSPDQRSVSVEEIGTHSQLGL